MTRIERLDILSRVVDSVNENERQVLAKEDRMDHGHLYSLLGGNAFFYAIHSLFVEKNIQKSKDYFNLQAKYKLKSSQLLTSQSMVSIFAVGRTLVCNVGISDNTKLIEIFAAHNYPINYVIRDKKVSTNFKSEVKKGDDSIYSELMLNGLSKNLNELETNLKIFRAVTLAKKKNERMNADLNFYESLLEADRNKIESSIRFFLTNKEHKYRNQHDLFPELISYPAVGYIKMALINGIDVDIQHDLVPMDLLLSQPLETYSDIISLQ